MCTRWVIKFNPSRFLELMMQLALILLAQMRTLFLVEEYFILQLFLVFSRDIKMLLHFKIGGLPFQRTLYHSFLSANRAFVDRLTKVLSPNEDLVWIHDYQLLALLTFLRKRFPRAKVRFFPPQALPAAFQYPRSVASLSSVRLRAPRGGG
jgi:hypothetical protein